MDELDDLLNGIDQDGDVPGEDLPPDEVGVALQQIAQALTLIGRALTQLSAPRRRVAIRNDAGDLVEMHEHPL